MIIYKLEVIYNNETYRQKYGDKIDITNALIELFEKGYITDDTYDKINDFFMEMEDTDLFTNAMIHPAKNIKLEMEMIEDDNNDYTIDALLRR